MEVPQNQLHKSVEDVLAGLALVELEEVPEGLGSVLSERLHGEDACAVTSSAHHGVEVLRIINGVRELLEGVVRGNYKPLRADLSRGSLDLGDEGKAVCPNLEQRLELLPTSRLGFVHDHDLLPEVPVPPLAVWLEVEGEAISLRDVSGKVQRERRLSGTGIAVEEHEAAVGLRRERALQLEVFRVVFAFLHIHEEEVGWQSTGEKQTGYLLSVITITNLVLVRLEYLAVGGTALARQNGVKQRLHVAFLVQDEDVLALNGAANLRLRLEDVAYRALLVLQGAQRQYVWMKRFSSHALQLHVEDRLRHAHRPSEAHEGVRVEPAGSRTALVPINDGLHVGELVKKHVKAPDRPSLHLLVVEVGNRVVRYHAVSWVLSVNSTG